MASGLSERLRRIRSRLAEAARVLEAEVGRTSDRRCKICRGRASEGHYGDDSQPCPFAVVERVISDLAELAAEQTEAPAAGERCTGLTAVWCPVHGDCTCRASSPEDGDRFDREFSSTECPLHGDGSDHATAEACEPLAAGELPAGWEAVEATIRDQAEEAITRLNDWIGDHLTEYHEAHLDEYERRVAAIFSAALKPLWPAPPPPAAWEAIEAGVRQALADAPCETEGEVAAVLQVLRSVELASAARAARLEAALRRLEPVLQGEVNDYAEDQQTGASYPMPERVRAANDALAALHAAAPPSDPWAALMALLGNIERHAVEQPGVWYPPHSMAQWLRKALGLPEPGSG